jgi:hypothetical protein
MPYETNSGDCVPERVRETFDHPDQWDRLDPEHVGVYESLIGPLYAGIVDGKRQYVTERGHASQADRYDHVQQLPDAALPPSSSGPFAYRQDVDVVHHDHYHEHVTKAIVVTGRHERITLCSRSGILWWQTHRNADTDPREASDTAVELAVALSDADADLSRPDDYTDALSGWHSSMEPSQQSDLINDLAAGRVPPEELDTTDPFPYAVKYGDTNNVCSQPVSIYASHDSEPWFRDAFDGTRARPAFAGVR